MTKEEIIEGNKIIASYMNVCFNGSCYSDYNECPPKAIVDKLKYNTSWDWLMPVVEDLYLDGRVNDIIIKPGITCIFLREKDPIISPHRPEYTSIMECFTCIVNCIKCFNK